MINRSGSRGNSAYCMLGKDVRNSHDIHYPLGKCSRTLWHTVSTIELPRYMWDGGWERKRTRSSTLFLDASSIGYTNQSSEKYTLKLEIDYLYVSGRLGWGNPIPEEWAEHRPFRYVYSENWIKVMIEVDACSVRDFLKRRHFKRYNFKANIPNLAYNKGIV